MIIKTLSKEDFIKKFEWIEEKKLNVRQRLVAAGRGDETHSDIMEKKDKLSRDYQYANNIYFALLDEKRHRWNYHNSLKPIPGLWSSRL